jgi:hypothetical protein
MSFMSSNDNGLAVSTQTSCVDRAEQLLRFNLVGVLAPPRSR